MLSNHSCLSPGRKHIATSVKIPLAWWFLPTIANHTLSFAWRISLTRFVVCRDFRVGLREVDECLRGVDDQDFRPDRDAGRFWLRVACIPDVAGQQREASYAQDAQSAMISRSTLMSSPKGPSEEIGIEDSTFQIQ